MAKVQNEVSENVVETNKTKRKKPFLVAGLVLLGLALIIGAAYFLTGSFLLLRNSIYFVGLSGAGIGIGSAVVKGIKNVVAKKGNSRNRQMVRNRERTQEREMTLESLPIPDDNRYKALDSWNPDKNNTNSQSKNNSNRR